MRPDWLIGLSFAVACSHSHDRAASDGQSIVASAGDHVVVGSLRLDVVSTGHHRLSVRMHEGSHSDSRAIAGSRIVKFGAHRIELDENEPNVSITVYPFKPSSPLEADDARFIADEAMSPLCQGLVRCDNATRSADGQSFVVRCHDDARSDRDRVITVDATTASVLSLQPAGGL